MDGYETESGSNRRLLIGLAVGAAVLVAVVVLVLVIVRRRAGDTAVSPEGVTNEPVSGGATEQPREEDPNLPPLPPVAPSSDASLGSDENASVTPATSSNGLTAGLVRNLTPEEMVQHGYPEIWVVQMRVRRTPGTDNLFAEYVILSKGDEPADQDEDGLSDEKEQEVGSDPMKPDTDGDGITDRDEVEQYKTDPTRADSDGDRVNDGQEVEQKRDPLSPGL